MTQISARSAHVALTWIRAGLRRMEPHRNGTPIPADILTALAELQVASTASGTTLDRGPVVPPPCEQISTAQAAQRLGITARAVRKRCAAGDLPATRNGRDWLIEWTEQGCRESSSTTPGTRGPTSRTASTTR